MQRWMYLINIDDDDFDNDNDGIHDFHNGYKKCFTKILPSISKIVVAPAADIQTKTNFLSHHHFCYVLSSFLLLLCCRLEAHILPFMVRVVKLAFTKFLLQRKKIFTHNQKIYM